MSEVQLSILTVNYRSSHRIKALLESLREFPPTVSWEIIIVDNFSSNAEAERIKDLVAEYKEAHLISLHQNYGYGFANNEAAKFARGKYLAVVNPDIEVKAGVFETLIEVLEREAKAGICVPVLETRSGDILDSVRSFPKVWDLITRRIKKSQWGNDPAKVRLVDWAQGSFWVLKKSLYEELGGFDERFFLFFEDTDLCRRVSTEKNLQILQVPSARAIHSPNRLSGGNLFLALFRQTFWIHVVSAVRYFWKWK